jgi:acyl transferase domain-containing protein
VKDRVTVLLLPGQGAQRERMAAGLFGWQPEFTACVTRLIEGLGADGDRLAATWLRTAPNPAMDEAGAAQPLLLMVGYALGVALNAVGRAPDLLLGHSVGELAAACLAGVFSPADVAPLVTARSRILGVDGRGGMLAVAAAPGELPAVLESGVSIAAVNGPRQCVLAGPSAALKAVEASLRAVGFTVQPEVRPRVPQRGHVPDGRPLPDRAGRVAAESTPHHADFHQDGGAGQPGASRRPGLLGGPDHVSRAVLART